MTLNVKPLKLPGLKLLQPQRFKDPRGFLCVTYQASVFAQSGIDEQFPQDIYSHSEGTVLRGLHYQLSPHAQGKLVRVIRGEVFDVAVDIRRGSPTFGQWEGVVLSGENGHMLYIPPGFAHGYCTLSPVADFEYKVTAEYAPQADRGIIWNDPDLAVEWPVSEPNLSEKDSGLPPLAQAEINFEYRAAD